MKYKGDGNDAEQTTASKQNDCHSFNIIIPPGQAQLNSIIQ